MRYSTVIEELSARPIYLLLVLFALLVVLHLLLVKWAKLGDVAWKRVDYVWLAVAAVGLLATSAQSGRFLAPRYIEYFERPRAITSYRWLHALLDEAYICISLTPSVPTSAVHDPFVRERIKFCTEARARAARMPKELTHVFPTLEDIGYTPLTSVPTFPLTTTYAQEVSEAAQQYRQQQQRVEHFLQASKLSSIEEVFIIIGPLLLTFALALRITKVTGEIANTRRKTED